MKKYSNSRTQSRFSSVPLFRHKRLGRASSLDAVFSALSDPTRRAMLVRLSQGEFSVTELAKPFQISLPAVSKHLSVLESAGLITRERDGRIHRLHLDPAPLISTAAWLDEYRPLWETQLEALSDYLKTDAREKKNR